MYIIETSKLICNGSENYQSMKSHHISHFSPTPLFYLLAHCQTLDFKGDELLHPGPVPTPLFIWESKQRMNKMKRKWKTLLSYSGETDPIPNSVDSPDLFIQDETHIHKLFHGVSVTGTRSSFLLFIAMVSITDFCLFTRKSNSLKSRTLVSIHLCTPAPRTASGPE